MENRENRTNKAFRVGIDMRMAGTGEGIGRYTEELVKNLSEIDQSNQYFLLTSKNSSIQYPVSRMTRVEVVSPYYSFAEQTKFIYELNKLNLDLVHFTSFNAPIFYHGRFVATVHDLIHHRFPGKKKSRLPHRLAYRWVMRSTIQKARKIITVSKATKKDLTNFYHEPEDKFEVVYEGVDKRFRQQVSADKIAAVREKYKISKPYVLFVGVWRQYKNLPRLAQAFDRLIQKHGHDLELVLAGKIDPFYPEIKQKVFSVKNSDRIKALGFVPDEDLPVLYQGASLFVLPSLLEGFGLIGVEAQTSGVPVAGSDIPVLREVLGEGAVYFPPKDVKTMSEKMHRVVSDTRLSKSLEEAGRRNAEVYDWRETAKNTLSIYEQAIQS